MSNHPPFALTDKTASVEWLHLMLTQKGHDYDKAQHVAAACNVADSNLHRCLVLMGGVDMRLSEAVQLLRDCGYIDEKESANG